MSRTKLQKTLQERKFAYIQLTYGQHSELIPIVGVREVGQTAILEVVKDGKPVALRLDSDAKLHRCYQRCLEISDLLDFDHAILVPPGCIPFGVPDQLDRRQQTSTIY